MYIQGDIMEKDKLRNKEKSIIFKNTYRKWKINSLDYAGYFTIFQGFAETEILEKISGNALKLYIYLGINSSNWEGVVWHSNKKIASYFHKSERTIRLWMKELENLNLIKRMQLEYNGNVYTYLMPYASKLDKNFDKNDYIMGDLIIDEIGSLCITNETIQMPITKACNVEILISNEWIQGRIISKRSGESFYSKKFGLNSIPDIDYIFESDILNEGIKIDGSKIFRIRIPI